MKLPTVLHMDGPVVIIGGGSVGMRKVEYISNFTQDIILVSEKTGDVPDHVKVENVTLNKENFTEFIPDDVLLVIAALSDAELNRAVAAWCMEHKILVNVVDDPDNSTVIFPALSKSGDLNISISTSGKCPFLARKIREEVDEWIDLKARWLQVLTPVREKLVGITEKNEVLAKIYGDTEISKLVQNGELESAKKKAMEVYNVHREH